MPEALLLTEKTVGVFAKYTDYTEERLRYVLERSQLLRYILVIGLDTIRGWQFMDDHYFRSIWTPKSEVNDKAFVPLLPKGK